MYLVRHWTDVKMRGNLLWNKRREEINEFVVGDVKVTGQDVRYDILDPWEPLAVQQSL